MATEAAPSAAGSGIAAILARRIMIRGKSTAVDSDESDDSDWDDDN